MKQNKLRRLTALLLALCLCAGLLAGCSKEDDDEPEEAPSRLIVAEKGGTGPEFSEEFDQTARLATEVSGDTMGVVFNGIQTRSTPYFTPSGSSITITARATTESESMFHYTLALWQQTDYGTTQYIEGRTVQFTADGSWYTATISGLTPGARYKLTLSYVNRTYYLSGSFAVRGLSSADADDEGEEGDEGGEG